MRIHWHRRDLRLADDRALAAAADGDRVVPAFVLDPDVLGHAGPPRVAYLLDALAGLRARYRQRGSDLLVRRGDPRDVLPDMVDEYDATAVHWNRDYSGLARERDAAVARALEAAGIRRERSHDALLHEPGSITTNEGDHYSVFSYFWQKWRDREKAAPLPAPDADALADVEGDTLPDLDALGVDQPEADVPDGSQAAARERLESFCDGPIYEYERLRDRPAADATSRLSADLKFGTVGVRTVYGATESAMDAVDDEDATAARGEADREDARSSVESFRRQLAWREFYVHVLAARPDVVTENYREYPREIEWQRDPEGLAAWRDGRTGYPLVDAGMRQLRAEAWMHNRVRMVVASFLTKDLLVDWRRGYEWFREKLVDHDPAADSGGWQWAASTGTDAQPYFRVFNPATQCERFDPDGEYVRAYVPELRDATAEVIHDWPNLPPAERERVAPEYPAPIVDHAECRERAIATFEEAREDG